MPSGSVASMTHLLIHINDYVDWEAERRVRLPRSESHLFIFIIKYNCVELVYYNRILWKKYSKIITTKFKRE